MSPVIPLKQQRLQQTDQCAVIPLVSLERPWPKLIFCKTRKNQMAPKAPFFKSRISTELPPPRHNGSDYANWEQGKEGTNGRDHSRATTRPVTASWNLSFPLHSLPVVWHSPVCHQPQAPFPVLGKKASLFSGQTAGPTALGQKSQQNQMALQISVHGATSERLPYLLLCNVPPLPCLTNRKSGLSCF